MKSAADKKWVFKRTVMVCLSFIILLTSAGCKKSDKICVNTKTTGVRLDNDKVEELKLDSKVMSIGKETVCGSEVLFYIYELKKKYEPALGEGLWNVQMENGQMFGEYAKGEVIRQITELKIICQKAKEEGVELTQDELEEARKLAIDYLGKASKEEIEKYGITQESLEKIFGENILASKMYDVTTGSVDTTIPEAEAKQICIQYLTILTEGIDKNGNKVSLKEEEKKGALKRIKQLLKEGKKTENFYNFADANSDIATVEMTFGASNQPEEFGSQALELKTGQFSKVITGKQGYYILYCASDYDEDATIQKKETIINERQDNMFEESYKKWSEEYEVVISSKLVNLIKM